MLDLQLSGRWDLCRFIWAQQVGRSFAETFYDWLSLGCFKPSQAEHNCSACLQKNDHQQWVLPLLRNQLTWINHNYSSSAAGKRVFSRSCQFEKEGLAFNYCQNETIAKGYFTIEFCESCDSDLCNTGSFMVPLVSLLILPLCMFVRNVFSL